ncbi:MAG: LysM peptidoglycan-binding domain-containing protein, partial [Bdellovibrionota bacterium]
LYNMFQSWELAAAAYNAGEAKIVRAVQRYGTRDFWALTRHRFLRPETRDYVPKIMAAAILEKNRTLFGFKPPGQGVPEPAEMDMDVQGGPLAEALDDDAAEPESVGDILQSNAAAPQTERNSAGGPFGSESQVPQAKPVSPPHVDRKGELSGEEVAEFEIRGPADLMMIARAANLSYPEVKALNPELLRWCTPPSVSYYRLKLPATAKDRFLAAYNHSEYPRRVEFLTYRAKNGDTLSRIANHFGIRVDPIVEMNRISPRSVLRKGSTVVLPMPNDRSRSLASLDLRDPPSKKRVRRGSGKRSKSKNYKVSYKRRESARSGVKRSAIVGRNDG